MVTGPKVCNQSAPILRVPDLDKDFCICMDALGQGLGVVFIQGQVSERLCIT
jgi:hypothetical protein